MWAMINDERPHHDKKNIVMEVETMTVAMLMIKPRQSF